MDPMEGVSRRNKTEDTDRAAPSRCAKEVLVSSVEAVGRTGQDGAMRARDIAVSLPTVTVRDPVLFSAWMTTLLHAVPDATEFDVRRQRGELSAVVESDHGRSFLAESYTGWPS